MENDRAQFTRAGLSFIVVEDLETSVRWNQHRKFLHEELLGNNYSLCEMQGLHKSQNRISR